MRVILAGAACAMIASLSGCGPGSEALSYSLGNESPPDLKESFWIGPIDVPDEPYFRGTPGNDFVMLSISRNIGERLIRRFHRLRRFRNYCVKNHFSQMP